MNRNVLVTGGNGFIGSMVLRKLIEVQDTPIIIRRNSSDMWRINEIIDRIVVYNIDNLSLSEVFEREKIDAVINLATYYRKFDSFEDIDRMVDSNIKFPTLLLQLCKEHDIPIFVTAGSYFQYGTNYRSMTVVNSTVARDLYAATKNALERIMEYYSSSSKTKTVELVLFTPYGEMDHEEKLIPYIIRQAVRNKPVKLSHGFQKLNLVYVEDVATAFVNALDLSAGGLSDNLIINIANIKSYSIRDLVEIIGDLLESHIDAEWNSLDMNKIDQDDELMVDTSRSREVLKWKPKFDIYEGLRRTIEYYRGEIIGN